MTVSHPALDPFALGDIELSNRLAVSPMTRVSATSAGVPTDGMARYYTEFAAGGFGLVITEGIYTDTVCSQGYLNQPGLVSAEHVDGWRLATQQVHAAGSVIFAQLMHAGALSQGSRYTSERIGPSAVQPIGEMLPEYGGRGRWPTPRAARRGDIDAVVSGFVDAATRARSAGFDGVEVHGANGYLIDQFLTDYTNQRTDSYGGDVRERARLAAEVVAAIVEEVGSGFPVGIRLSQTKVNDFHHRWEGARDAEIIFGALYDAGARYLHIASEGRNWIETARLDGGLTITGLARKITGLPVIANGGMHDAAQARQVIDDGHADIVAIGRGALANPDLPHRIAKDVELADFEPAMLHPMATLENARTYVATGRRRDRRS